MEEKFTGCILGGAIGDALGMASEGNVPALSRITYGYRRAGRGFPNEELSPGQYTDDTQMMILTGTLLADGRFTVDRYGSALSDAYSRGILRNPDGTIAAACERLLNKAEKSGVNSTTSGCLSIAVPFALAYPDIREMTERASLAAAVTHTTPSVHAAVATVSVLIHSAVSGNPDPVAVAAKRAWVENESFGKRIADALDLAQKGTGIESAVLKIGNDLSVGQTVPMAFFLIRRYTDPSELFTIASHIGGNTDTICLICGAYLGALKGKGVLPPDLVDGLEDSRRIEMLGKRLFQLFSKKH